MLVSISTSVESLSCLLVEPFLPLELGPLDQPRPAEPKFVWSGSKIFDSESSVIIVSEAIPVATL